jgi:hypothetical protein
VLKAEVHQGLKLDRSQNLRLADYNVTSNHNLFGASWKTYSAKNKDDRHFLDMLEADSHRPFLVSLTCLVESPMKLYLKNQNHTSILFGTNDDENVKNVVRFEAELRWFDFLNLLPVDNK